MATYVEGSSLHPERGGASTFARYAFNELWSFVAGWAILLDYLIVMAIGAVVDLGLPGGLLDRARRAASPEIVIAGVALLYVAVPEHPRPLAPTGSAWCCACRCSASSLLRSSCR